MKKCAMFSADSPVLHIHVKEQPLLDSALFWLMF